MKLVALAEVGQEVAGPLIGLGQEQRAGIARLDELAHLFEEFVGFGQVFAVGPFALDQVGNGIDAKPVDPAVEPERHDVEHLLA